MANTDYKIVGNKMYIYPNTETEQQLMNGQIAPVEGYTTYITVENYYKTVEAQSAYKDRLAQYDFYVQCVRVPEWLSDTPTPPQPTYRAITVNDSYGISYILQYTSGETVDPSAVEVGKQVVFSTNDPAYTQTFPDGLDVSEYGTLPSGATSYKFRMPDYDVTITITEVQPQPTHYSINLVNEYSAGVDLRDINWDPLDSNNVQAGTNIMLFVNDYNYKAISSDVDLGTPIWDLDYGHWDYRLVMPSNNITITITNRNDAGIHYNGNTDIAIQVGETPEYPTLENPNNVSPIIYSSSNTYLATVDSNGNVNLTSGVVGETYIKATFEGDSTYDLSQASFKLTVKDGVEIAFIKTGAVESENVRMYNITKQQEVYSWWVQTRPNDTIFVVGAAQDDKVMYKDSSNNWTTLNSSYTTETIEGNPENGIKFTMSSSINPFDYVLIMTNADDLYDVTTGTVNGVLFNETGLADWWYYVEDPAHPGTYSTKYPNGTNLGIESRNGETYTINPEQTLLEGGTVGKYIVMPSTAIEITKTN